MNLLTVIQIARYGAACEIVFHRICIRTDIRSNSIRQESQVFGTYQIFCYLPNIQLFANNLVVCRIFGIQQSQNTFR